MTDSRTLTLGSLFDGSGGFPLGGILSGIEPVWSSEIEPFPILVTHKRLPDMKHYGDVSTLRGGELEPVDIITFGSPCQDMSIAGRRAGLDGERSGLFFQAIRVIKEMREATNGKYPRYCVWENVPGAFSSNKGEDFRAVIEAVIGIKEEGIEVPPPENNRWAKADVLLGDGWSVAYRVFDAQYWGVPQRRARIYLVADLNGGCAGEILFKSEGLSGYSAEGVRSWQRAAGRIEESAGEAGRSDEENGVTYCVNPQGSSGVAVTEDKTLTLVAQDHGNHPSVLRSAGFSTEHSAQSRSIGYEEEKSPTLRAGVVPAALSVSNHPTDSRVKIDSEGKVQTLTERMGTGGCNIPLVAEPDRAASDKRNASAYEENADKSYAISRIGFNGGEKAAFNFAVDEEISPTLETGGAHAVAKPEIKAFGVCAKRSNSMLSDNPRSGFYEAKTSRTLDRSGGNAVLSNQGGVCVVAPVPDRNCSDVIAFEPGVASRIGGHIYEYGKSGTLRANTGDNIQAVTYALQGSMIGRKDKNGPQGDGVSEEVGYALNTCDKHAVAYGLDRASYNQGQNAKFGFAVEEELKPTITAKSPGAVAHSDGGADAVYSANKGRFFTDAYEEITGPLLASDYKEPPLVNDIPNNEPDYIVRRLTPQECALLQGFPAWWCKGLAIPDPTDEEIAFWTEVWETWRSVTNPGGKPKTEKQIRKWLADPYTDAAEYKLWGNGLCVNIAYFVLSGIKWAYEREASDG